MSILVNSNDDLESFQDSQEQEQEQEQLSRSKDRSTTLLAVNKTFNRQFSTTSKKKNFKIDTVMHFLYF